MISTCILVHHSRRVVLLLSTPMTPDQLVHTVFVAFIGAYIKGISYAWLLTRMRYICTRCWLIFSLGTMNLLLVIKDHYTWLVALALLQTTTDNLATAMETMLPKVQQVSTITPPKVINKLKRCINGSVIKMVLATGNYISCIIKQLEMLYCNMLIMSCFTFNHIVHPCRKSPLQQLM